MPIVSTLIGFYSINLAEPNHKEMITYLETHADGVEYGDFLYLVMYRHGSFKVFEFLQGRFKRLKEASIKAITKEGGMIQ